MAETELSPLGPIRLAVSVDDLFQWLGTPELPGYSAVSITRKLTDAFAAHGLQGVYGFSNTAPADGDPALYKVFDHWAETGHHTANHTHNHASLNWVPASHYIEDIERTEKLIARWSDRAPTRYFRHCFDMWGDTAEKQAEVAGWLARAGYEIAPISVWFYDAQFAIAYMRAVATDDREAKKYLRVKCVETAVEQLRVQTAAARLMFDRDPAHILLLHGTAIAADCTHEILDRYAALGVEFIPLEEAMKDPMNRGQPVVTAKFRNQVQKWAELKSVTIENCPPAILAEIEEICPVEGMMGHEIMADLLLRIAKASGAKPDLSDFAIA